MELSVILDGGKRENIFGFSEITGRELFVAKTKLSNPNNTKKI